MVQFIELFKRLIFVTKRSPLAMIALMGFSAFISVLLISIYGGVVAKTQLNLLDM